MTTDSSNSIPGYQGADGIEMEEDVIVCPKCGYMHVDEETGDTCITSDLVKTGRVTGKNSDLRKNTDDNIDIDDKLVYFRCYQCKYVMWTEPVGSQEDYLVPKEVQRRMKVRKTWSLIQGIFDKFADEIKEDEEEEDMIREIDEEEEEKKRRELLREIMKTVDECHRQGIDVKLRWTDLSTGKVLWEWKENDNYNNNKNNNATYA